MGNVGYWVLLVSGWFSISKTIIPDAQEHFLPHSTRRDTHLFGGFGLRVPIWEISVKLHSDLRSFDLPSTKYLIGVGYY